ncbi:MAG: hypothetical protein GAK31_00889 [Stenotrophomonas maltophilia]|uniref:HPt domain-containing protein n=1 Tax=Stenotrophomonas maltophilia TaxID=40324 RepID=A0A7V8JNQ2_STEMA|nr:MAG: hypothetical protein GAK31_00889 [Stenotrophomonas maltophilia]
MSSLRDAMSHAALGWVKPELDETLRQARNEVEFFAEDPSDSSRMRLCAGYLHQVQGTLRMVELYAPAMVAEELEQLANAVGAGQVPDRDEACATLMRGSVLLPDYLERLQNGHRDIPIVLLPLLNDIRAARGAPGINESVLFAFAPDSASASEAELDHARGSLSGRNRELLDTVGNAVKEELLRIKDALDLHLRTGAAPEQLQVQANELNAVADTLGMMGLGVARNVVVQQRDALRAVVGGRPSTKACCWISPARCCTWMPRWMTRCRTWAPVAVVAMIPAWWKTAAQWKCWRMKPSPISPPRANTSWPSSKPAGTMPSCRTCRA